MTGDCDECFPDALSVVLHDEGQHWTYGLDAWIVAETVHVLDELASGWNWSYHSWTKYAHEVDDLKIFS